MLLWRKFRLHALELLAALFDGVAKSRDLFRGLRLRDMKVVGNQQRVESADGAPDGDAGRSHDAANDAFDLHPFRYSQMQSTASFSSEPSARTTRVEPWAAARRRMLRMLRASASIRFPRSSRKREIARLVLAGKLNDAGRGASMKPKPVPDNDLAFGHARFLGASRSLAL